MPFKTQRPRAMGHGHAQGHGPWAMPRAHGPSHSHAIVMAKPEAKGLGHIQSHSRVRSPRPDDQPTPPSRLACVDHAVVPAFYVWPTSQYLNFSKSTSTEIQTFVADAFSEKANCESFPGLGHTAGPTA